MDIWTSLSQTLAVELLGQVLSASSRTYWVYLATSVPLVFLAGLLERRHGAALPPHLRSFGFESWFSRSAINDYGLILFNALLFAGLLGAAVPNISVWTERLSDLPGLRHPGLAQSSAWWAPVLLAFCLFLVDDFLRFVLHFAEHRVGWMWELHKVHHSAEVLNFMTSERQHPIANLYFRICCACGAIAVNLGFLAVFGAQISPKALLGGNLFWVGFNLLGGTLRHSSTWISFGPVVEKWLISPAQHQIHHSDDPKHFDANLGGTLAIWDRMAGTLYLTSHTREVIRYGLGAETRQYRTLGQLFFQPVLRIFGLGAQPQPAATTARAES